MMDARRNNRQRLSFLAILLVVAQAFQPRLGGVPHSALQRSRPLASTVSWENDTYQPAAGQGIAPSTDVTITPPTPHHHHDIHSVDLLKTTGELAEYMAGTDEEELTIVKFYAHYCKICQRAGMQFKKISAEYPQVRFGKVESQVFPDSANTLRDLGVSKFPFIQIFRKGQCVASFSTGPSHIFVKKVRDTLDTCLQRTPEEWDAFTTEFSNEIEANRQARESLLPRATP